MLRKALATAILLVVVGAGRAGAVVPDAKRSGHCQLASTYSLSVTRYDATRLRVRFAIAHATPGQTWLLFGSDNGTRIFTLNRVVSASGTASVRRYVKDRPGTDRIKGRGFNSLSGELCGGSVSF